MRSLLNEILKQHRDGRPDLFESGESAGKYDREHFEALLNDPACVVFVAHSTANLQACK